MGLNWVEGGLREHHGSLCWPGHCAWLSRAGWDLGLVFQSQISFVGHTGFSFQTVLELPCLVQADAISQMRFGLKLRSSFVYLAMCSDLA